MKSIFSKRLCELRKEKGAEYTRQRVANDLEISRASLEYYEKGQRLPDIEIAAKIADYYGVSTDYLLGRPETKAPEGEDVNEILNKQIALLSKASEVCAENVDLIQYLPAFTQALNSAIAAKDIHNGRTNYTYGFGRSNIDYDVPTVMLRKA